MADLGTIGLSLESSNSAIDRLATQYRPTKSWSSIAGLGEVIST